MEKEENILGTEKIGKLIRKFSIPCIISLLVNSLYNIIDQIFIGWGVGYIGNGATNVVFPLTMIGLALSLMFGDGASAYLSLKLRRKEKRRSSKRCRKCSSNIINNINNILRHNINIFTTIINNVWMHRNIKRICNKIWFNNSNRITIFNDRNNIKLNNKSRW